MSKNTAKRFNGYRVKEQEYGWKPVKHQIKASSYLGKGKVIGKNSDGTYQVSFGGEDIDTSVSEDKMVKLSGTRIKNGDVLDSSLFRPGDRVRCKRISEGGPAQMAWYNPRTQEVRWNCPEPPSRTFRVFESVAEFATDVTPIAQKSRVKTTENVPNQFKR